MAEGSITVHIHIPLVRQWQVATVLATREAIGCRMEISQVALSSQDKIMGGLSPLYLLKEVKLRDLT